MRPCSWPGWLSCFWAVGGEGHREVWCPRGDQGRSPFYAPFSDPPFLLGLSLRTSTVNFRCSLKNGTVEVFGGGKVQSSF